MEPSFNIGERLCSGTMELTRCELRRYHSPLIESNSSVEASLKLAVVNSCGGNWGQLLDHGHCRGCAGIFAIECVTGAKAYCYSSWGRLCKPT